MSIANTKKDIEPTAGKLCESRHYYDDWDNEECFFYPERHEPEPDPREKWAHRLTMFGIGITIGACLMAVFGR